MTTRRRSKLVSQSPVFVRGVNPHRASAARWSKGKAAALLAAVCSILFAQTGSHAQPGTGALPFTESFLVTGDYVVGGVDLNEDLHPIVNGFSTATIPMSGVPANADIVAAYLFWETITKTSNPEQASGVKFRGNDINIDSVLTVKRTSLPLEGSTASCWSSGDPLQLQRFRADVLRFLPIRVDVNDAPTTKRLVNDADLTAHGQSQHTVTLPVRNGNGIPESAGATLMVVYRDPAQALRKIVVYDGAHIKPGLNVPVDQTLQGFYQSSAVKSAKITHIAAFGQPNNNEKIRFNGVQVSDPNPFASGTSSQRGWGNPTYDVSAQMSSVTNVAEYGETATTSVVHEPANGGFDCLTWGTVVFSTEIADIDNDGLPDGLEDAAGVLKDPDDTPLPNLNAMGAGSDVKDLFVEFNASRAAPGTWYGNAAAPFSATETTKTDTAGHNHLPTPEVLKMLGDAFQAQGIRPHFDVGPHGPGSVYRSFGVIPHTDWVDDYTSGVANGYLVPSDLARGGELIEEIYCQPSEDCQFPAYPGTVYWKLGLQILRDAPVGDGGQHLLTLEEIAAWSAGGTKRRRFDPGRKGLFHYVLNPHARGKPKNPFPCLVGGLPGPYDTASGTACTTPNPDYHTPSSTSGVADLPGGNAMVTLGLWTEFVGRPFLRASTTFHELGHNLELWHSGVRAVWGNKALSTANNLDFNCKPNHLSSMSYLFVAHGLFTINGNTQSLDYSRDVHTPFDESTTLTDVSLSPTPLYRPAWFAPAGSTLAATLGASPATKFCSGVKFNPLSPPAPMARVFATNVAPFQLMPLDLINWKGDTLINSAIANQDVNFDGALGGLNGYDDWDNLRLNQIGAAETGLAGGSAESITVFVESITAAVESITALAESPDITDAERASITAAVESITAAVESMAMVESITAAAESITAAVESITAAAESITAAAESITAAAESITAAAESITAAAESVEDDFSYDTANGIGKGVPVNFRACIIGTPGCSAASALDPLYHRAELRFNAPPFGDFTYEFQRKREGQPDSTFVAADTTPTSTTNSFVYAVDRTELAHDVTYVYRMRGAAADGNTPWVYATVTGVNDAPVAAADGVYQVNLKSTLTVPATGIPGILVNDSDGDSPSGNPVVFLARRAVLVSGPTVGTLTCGNTPGICADGSFKYTPPKSGGFQGGLVTFTYRSDSGLSGNYPKTDPALPKVALSPPSNLVTVTINVFK